MFGILLNGNKVDKVDVKGWLHLIAILVGSTLRIIFALAEESLSRKIFYKDIFLLVFIDCYILNVLHINISLE